MSRRETDPPHQAALDLAGLLGGLDALLYRVDLTDIIAPDDRSAPAAIPLLVIECKRRAEALADELDQIEAGRK